MKDARGQARPYDLSYNDCLRVLQCRKKMQAIIMFYGRPKTKLQKRAYYKRLKNSLERKGFVWQPYSVRRQPSVIMPRQKTIMEIWLDACKQAVVNAHYSNGVLS
jgi:hypothetical protein